MKNKLEFPPSDQGFPKALEGLSEPASLLEQKKEAPRSNETRTSKGAVGWLRNGQPGTQQAHNR